MTCDVTVIIPTIAPRRLMLQRALRSVAEQTVAPACIIVEEDREHRGAPATRQAALEKVRTPLVAPLDDDDYWYPDHLETLVTAMAEHDADVVYPWFDGNDPFPQFEGRPWDNDDPHLFPICYLAKTQVLLDAGGFTHVSIYGHEIVAGEDWPVILTMAGHRPDADGVWHREHEGAKIVHVPKRTWYYQAHAGNTSGLPHRVPWGAVLPA